MNWDAHKANWPNADCSRFVTQPGHRWHIQDAGTGDTVLMLHGAGASTHSWRHVFALMRATHRVVAIDLPGHGFTRVVGRKSSGLTQMASSLETLLATEGIAPNVVLCHSAGSALALQMALDGHFSQDTKIVSINGALSQFGGIAGVLFPAIAKVLASSSLTASLFSRTATRNHVEKILKATGSQIDDESVTLYQSLFSNPAHVDGALMMMAQWELDALIAALPTISTQTLFLTGALDRTVPPQVSKNAAARMPRATHVNIDGVGHLLHEERPDIAVEQTLGFLADAGLTRCVE